MVKKQPEFRLAVRSGQNPQTVIASLLGQTLRRNYTVETSGIDEKSRTVELSFSSNIELARWPGVIEVLSHEVGAVRMTRLLNKAPLLFNHNWDLQLGVVENASISNGKGRASVRFGTSDLAEEKWQDVKNGILVNVSVGYKIYGIKLAEEREGVDVYLVIDWEPYEITLCTVPADITVGVGRNLNAPLFMNRQQLINALTRLGVSFSGNATDAELMALLATANTEAPTIRTLPAAPAAPAPTPGLQVGEEARRAGAAGERERMTTLRTMGEKFRCPELAQKAIEEGTEVQAFRQIVLDNVETRIAGLNDANRGVGLSVKESKSFSFVRLARSILSPADVYAREQAGFEHAACRAAADQRAGATRGYCIPVDVLRQPCDGELHAALMANLQQRAGVMSIASGPGYTGNVGNLVQTTLLTSSFTALTQASSMLLPLATPLSGLVGNFEIAKQLTKATSGWVGEDQAGPQTSVDFGIMAMQPRTVSCWADLTRKSLMQSSMDVEAFVRLEMATAMGLEIDTKGLYGDGTGNTPTGIKYTSGIGAKAFASGAAPTFAELVDMETQMSTKNMALNSVRYLAHPKFRGYAKTARKIATSTDSITIWEPGNTVNGYATGIGTQIQDGNVIFGQFAEMLIGSWGGIDLTVDPYSNSTKGRLRLVMFQDVDWLLKRPEAIVFGEQ